MSGSQSSDADSTPKVTVEGKGLGIEKAFAADEFDTPAIVLTITNRDTTPVSLRIIDPLPEELDQSDIGFHPEYAAEGWTRREDGDLQLDRELEGSEEIKSVYGIRLSEVQDPASLLQEPTIVYVDAIDEADEEDPGTADADAGAVDEAITDGDEDGDGVGEDADAEAEDESEDTTSDPGRQRTAAAAGETVDGMGTPTTAGKSVAEALAAELERGSVDQETLRTLNDHLEPQLAQSSQVRIDNVQARLSDLEAYTDALESILDTIGTDDDISKRMKTIQEDLEGVATQTDGLREDLNRTMDDLDDTEADLETTRAELESDIDDLQSEVSAVGDSVDDVEGHLQDVDDTVEDLESRMGTSVEDLEGTLDDLRSDIDDLAAWRDNFVGAVGGAAGAADDGDDDEE